MSKWKFKKETEEEIELFSPDDKISAIQETYPRRLRRYEETEDDEELRELEKVITTHIPKDLKVRTYNSKLAYEKLKHKGKTLKQIENEFLEYLSQLTDRDTQDQVCFILRSCII